MYQSVRTHRHANGVLRRLRLLSVSPPARRQEVRGASMIITPINNTRIITRVLFSVKGMKSLLRGQKAANQPRGFLRQLHLPCWVIYSIPCHFAGLIWACVFPTFPSTSPSSCQVTYFPMTVPHYVHQEARENMQPDGRWSLHRGAGGNTRPQVKSRETRA